MEQIIIKICVLLLSISNIGMLVVMIKFTDKVKLHSKLISELLDNMCNIPVQKEDEEEEDAKTE